MRNFFAIICTALIITGCASQTPEELTEQTQSLLEDDSTDVEEEAPALAVVTTTAAPTTTTTTTIPGPRWEYDESYEWNMDYLVGAPVDPDFQREIDSFDSFLSGNGFSVRERYWANYVFASDLACESLNNMYDLGIEENWNVFEAEFGVNTWIEIMQDELVTLPGFAGLSDDETMTITAGGIAEGGCMYIWTFFDDFING